MEIARYSVAPPGCLVELLADDGTVRFRHRARELPCTLGRAPSSDIFLDDRYVDPLHAVLEAAADGGLTLVDRGSLNGIRDADGVRLTSGALRIEARTTVRLGRTTVRFLPLASEPEATLRLPDPAPAPSAMASGGMVVGAVVAGLATVLASDLASTTDGNVALSLVGTLLLVGVAWGIWAGGWAVLGRLVLGRTALGRQLALAALGTAVLIAGSTVVGWIGFARPSWSALPGVATTALLAGLAALLFGHVHLAIDGPRWRSLGVVAVVGATLAAIGWWGVESWTALGFVEDEPVVLGDWGIPAVPNRLLATTPLDDALDDLSAEFDEALAHELDASRR